MNLLAAPRSACLIESQPLRLLDEANTFVALPAAGGNGTAGTYTTDGAGLGGRGGSRGRAGAANAASARGVGGGGGGGPAHRTFDETYAELCSILGIRYVLTPTTPEWVLPPAALADALATACDRRNAATLRHPPRRHGATAADGESKGALPQPRSRRRIVPSGLLARQGWVSWEGD